MPLPISPFDGQIFIDAFRVKWVFDGEVECWRSRGQVPDIPIATSEQPGLMSAEVKNALDGIPLKGGGFGIIVDPKLAVRTAENPDGIVFGDVELLSNSLKIDCVHSDGSIITPECQDVPYAPETGQLPPGFDVNFREVFLETICAEIPGGPGPVGDQGATGKTGRPGTGDGPVGAKGEDGQDATEAATFTGIIIEETDDIFDTAVVDLELNADEGKLHVVKANIKVPDDETPADKVIASSIFRSLEFTTGFQFNILKGQDELDADVTLGNYPPGFDIESDIELVQPNATKLSQYIQKIAAFYEGKLAEVNDVYNKEIEEFFKTTDEAARQKLDILSEELANCEFRLPLEYCIGINPQDCQEGGAQVGGQVDGQEGGLCALADIIFPGAGFCDDPPGQDLGTITLKANEMESVQFSGTATLPKGGYMVVYSNGTLFDSGQPGRGYYVGTTKTGVGVEAEITRPNGVATTIKLPVSGETYDKFDSDSVEQAYQNGPIEERSINFFFDDDGSSILLKAPTDTDAGTGRVNFRIIRCLECEDAVTP